MKARDLFEMTCPAPVAPPKEKPHVIPGRPAQSPGRPARRPNPFRRKDIKPGHEPKPKASLGGYAYENITGTGMRRADDVFQHVKLRFLSQAVRGYSDQHGVYHPPVSAEEAERLWQKKAPEVLNSLRRPDLQTSHRFGIEREPAFDEMHGYATYESEPMCARDIIRSLR